MKLAVKDANVLIDLVEADLLGHWFKLGIETHTTNLVINEVSRPNQKEAVGQFVNAGLIKVHILPAVSMPKAAELSQTWKISLPDASAVHLAQELKAILLTGDGTVRKVATTLQLETRGVLWVIDHLVEKVILTPAAARSSLVLLMKSNSFLPKPACEERLKKWSGS